MKKQFYAAMAAVMVAGMASAQTVSVLGLDGNVIATYNLDQIDQIVFTPAEGQNPPEVDPNIPEGAIYMEFEVGQQYEGLPYALDYDAVAEELDVPSLSDTYVEVFAVQNGELSQEYTANEPGFWFNKDGIICGWATDGCAVYVEYRDGVFYCGQFPGTMAAGDVVEVELVMMANDVELRYPFYFKWVAAEAVEGNVVYEENVEGSAPVTNDYTPIFVDFDADAIAAAIGVEDLNEARFIFVQPDGAYENIYTAGPGYYINADGTLGSWGDGSPYYIEYYGNQDPEDYNYNQLVIGQYTSEPYTTYKSTVGFYANKKIALIHVTYTTTEDARPEPETEE